MPAFSLLLLLQRSPVIRHLAELEFSLLPRVQHIWTVVVGAVTVGAYNSVTAASGDLRFREPFSDTTVKVGEQLRIVIEVEGSNLTPGTWIVNGALPAGVTAVTISEAATTVIDGIPTQVGSFPVTVEAWQEAGMGGDEGIPLAFVIVVEAAGPVINEHPSAQTVSWGGNTELSIQVQQASGTTYQWQRILAAEAEYSNIPGQTGSSLSLSSVTSAHEGMYRVVATNSSGSVESNPAMVTVNSTPFQRWREMNFENPFSPEAAEDQNHDFDPYINLVESLFGGNPTIADIGPFPETSTEQIGDTLYAVFRFPVLVAGTADQLAAEVSTSLAID
ncbi:MAG: immunoglobulin domain-containing protein, partial [Verrucomicrobiae bacterium]|nr:immunoglobulin domain-containing protein [Verrucomicrobiae bacterium]